MLKLPLVLKPATPPLGPCRFCGNPAWGLDAGEPAHRCCASPTTMCIACPVQDGGYLQLSEEHVAQGLRLHPGCTWKGGYPCVSCRVSQNEAARRARWT